MKLTESYLKRLIKQAINEMQDPFSVTAQDPALDYQDLYDEYVRNGVKIERGEFNNLINILNKMKVINPRQHLETWLRDISINRSQPR
jgi:hypothetical protein